MCSSDLLAVLALMPSARPLRWAHLLFTYMIPMLPFLLLWDGMVSMLRIYSPEQMRQLTGPLSARLPLETRAH